MTFIKKLLSSFAPRPLLLWGKKRYYARVVPTFHEPEVEPIRSLVAPGDTTLDLGANVGWYTAILAQLVGPSGNVYSVEPVPETFKLLSAVIDRLRLTNVEAFNCAVSNKAGSALMEIPKHEYGGQNFYMARIIAGDSRRSSPEQVRVSLRSLDSMLPPQVAKQVTFIKCDVEGHELAVLQGARDFFANSRPAMLVEVTGTPDTLDAPGAEFGLTVREYGYTPYFLDAGRLYRREPGHSSVNYFFLQPHHLSRLALFGV